MKKMLKGFVRFLLQILCSTALIILIDLFWHGVPLWGIPQAEHITQVEISDTALNETRIFTGEEKIRLARGCAGCLKYQPGSAGEGEAQITVRYIDEGGRCYEVSANASSVFYNGKARLLKERELFINVTEGIFFFDTVVSRS